MTLEKFHAMVKDASVRQCYHNETGAAPLLVSGLTFEQLLEIISMAQEAARAATPVDFQI